MKLHESLIQKPVPEFPGMWKVMGPAVIWLALAQGSGELIWWPYIIAKYGLAFLFLLIPACLLQYPLNYQIGTYTLLTGESIFQGFLRLNRFFSLFLWVLMTLSFLWFGAFAGAGGTSLAALTHFPHGWSGKAQTLFWAYLSMGVFFVGLMLSKVVYRFIEKIMWFVSLVTLAGLVVACSHADVLRVARDFFRGLVIPQWPLPRPWEWKDATKLLTAVTFAGLGGFWTLFYSYWLREKGAGMAAYMGHVTGPITGKKEPIPQTGFTFAGTEEDWRRMRKWKKYLAADSAAGIAGNIATTLMTCLLAYALLYPQGILPERYEIAVVQAKFFEVSWGVPGRLVFLFVAACFLSDTWLTTLDAVSRIHTDFFQNFFPGYKRFTFLQGYYFFVVFFTVITGITILFNEPGPLILLSAVIGFAGTVSFSIGLIFLNYRRLPELVPPRAVPGKFFFWGLVTATVSYAVLAVLYFGTLLFQPRI